MKFGEIVRRTVRVVVYSTLLKISDKIIDLRDYLIKSRRKKINRMEELYNKPFSWIDFIRFYVASLLEGVQSNMTDILSSITKKILNFIDV